MALTQKQFNNLRKKGLSIEQIVKFEKGTQPKIQQPDMNKFDQFALGAGKGIVSTIRGASSLGEKILSKPFEAVGIKKKEETAAEQLIPKGVITPESTTEKIGFFLEQAAELFAPIGMAGKATRGANLLTKGIVEGGTIGAQIAVQEGEVNKDVVKSAATGAVFPVVGKALGVFGKSLTEALPERLIRSAVGQSKKVLEAGKDVSEYIIKNKRIGTANSLMKSAQDAIEDLSGRISSKLKSVSGQIIKRDEIIDDVVGSVNDTGGAITGEEVNSVIQKLAPQAKGLLQKESLTLIEANKLRQSIDRTLGDRGFLTSQLPFNKELLKDFTNKLRETVKQKAPDGTRDLFNNLAKEINLRNAVVSKYIGRDRNQIISFGDLIGGGLGGFAGGVPGALVGAAIRRGIESPFTKTKAGVALGQLQRFQNLSSKIAPEIKAFLIQILQDD